MALTKVTGQVIKSDTNITSHNINSSGIITAVSFSGPLDTTGGNFTGIITATSATFSGNVTIGGTLTYEDVTNIDSVGIITARSTVSIADSIVHTGDINTAIRFPSPDTFTVETGGDERLRITSAGLVNIGGAAVSQSRSLNIGSNAEANLAIETHNDATSETANIRFYKSGNTGASPQVVETDDNIAQLIAYGHDGTDYANAAASIKMSVDGAPGGNDMPGKIIFSTNAGGTSPSERLRITSAGLVGLGIAAPTEKLHVIGQVGGTNPTAGSKWDIARFVAHDYSPTNSGGLTIGAYWHNTTVAERKSYIQSSQNTDSGSTARDLLLNPDGGSVGIGTDAPAGGSSLHINGSGASDKNHIRLTADRGLIGRFGDTSGSAQAMFDLYGTDGSTQIVRFISGGGVNFVNTGGNLGVGTDNPGTPLHVYHATTNEAARFESGDATCYVTFGDNVSNTSSTNRPLLGAKTNDLFLQTGGSERFRITSDGDVGIGTVTINTTNGQVGRKLGIFSSQNNVLASETTSSSHGFLIEGRRTGRDTDKPRYAQLGLQQDGSGDGIIKFLTAGDGADITERLRIQSTGQLLYSAASGDNTITSKRTNAAGSNGNYFFHLKATDNNDNNVGELGFHQDGAVDASRFVVKTRNTGGSSTERLRITSAGKVGINTDSPSAALTVSSPSGGLGDSTIGAGWLDQYDVDCIRVFHNATGRIGVYTIEQGDWSSGIVLGTIDGSTTRKWGIGMAANAKSAHNNGLYFGYLSSTDNAGANTFNSMRKDIIISSNGNVNIDTGDLVIGTNNKGISFSGSSSTPDSTATSSTRIMTDYDEGTCPWELHRAGALTTGSNSSDTRVSYTKIGNRVFMSGYVYTQSTGSSTGVVAQLTNASGGVAELPYTAAHDGVMAISKTRTIDDNWRHMAVGFAKDGKQVYLYGDDGNNAYTPEHNNISINSNQTHLVIAFSGSYETTE